MVHAQLQHRQPVRLAQAQQGQGHADVVVEIALGGQRCLAHCGAQHGGDELRHRGLAVAAGDGDQRQFEARTPALRQLAQGGAGVGHFDAGQPGRGQPALGHRPDGPGGARLGQPVVAVETLSAQRHKQIARAQGAGVGVHAQHRRADVAHGPRTRQQRQQLHQLVQVASPCSACQRRCSASRPCTTSEKGWRTPAISW